MSELKDKVLFLETPNLYEKYRISNFKIGEQLCFITLVFDTDGQQILELDHYNFGL